MADIKKIKEEYEKIIMEINAELIASRLEMKHTEKRMEDIMIKARKNIHELSLLL